MLWRYSGVLIKLCDFWVYFVELRDVPIYLLLINMWCLLFSGSMRVCTAYVKLISAISHVG